jgi:hypothetical protein
MSHLFAHLAECHISKSVDPSTKYRIAKVPLNKMMQVGVVKNSILTSLLVDTLKVSAPFCQLQVMYALQQFPDIPVVWDNHFAYKFKLIEVQPHELTFYQFCVRPSAMYDSKLKYINKRKVKLVFR